MATEKKPKMVFTNEELTAGLKKADKEGGKAGQMCYKLGVTIGMNVIKTALVEDGQDEDRIQEIIDGTMEEKKSTRKSNVFMEWNKLKKADGTSLSGELWKAHHAKCKNGCDKCKSKTGKVSPQAFKSWYLKDIKKKAAAKDPAAMKLMARVNKALADDTKAKDASKAAEEEGTEEIEEVVEKPKVVKKPAAPVKKPAAGVKKPAAAAAKKPTVRRAIQ